MNAIMAENTLCNKLTVEDYGLNPIIDRAVLEYDQAVQDKSVDFKYAKLFAEFLKASILYTVDEHSEKKNYDFDLIEIVGKALNASNYQGEAKTVQQVIERVSRITDTMISSSMTLDKKGLEQMRQFCVEFSYGLMNYHSFISASKTSASPYWR